MDLQELIRAVAVGVNSSSIYGYKSNPGGQTNFHKSESYGRLLVGDNRSGKTEGGIAEDVYWLLGIHPYLDTPEPPVYGRIITVDSDYGCDQIILPKLSKLIPPSALCEGSWERSYNKRKSLLKLRNGSSIEIKTHGQDIESFAGVARHFLHVDEECPKAVFIESKMRLLDFNGKFWITYTPAEGQTWIYEELVEKDPRNVKVFIISIRDNPHISHEGLEVLEEDLDDEEKAIRLGAAKGKTFTPRGGLVYPNFNYDRHVIDPGLPPAFWQLYASVDHGFNNPTAWLWHAVSPDGMIITFMEHYKSEMTVRQHAERVLQIESEEIKRTPFLRIGDPSMSQRSPVTGHSILVEYTMNGVNIKPGKKQTDDTEIDRINDYLRRNMWLITSNCINFIREIRKLPWKRYQSPKIADLNNRRNEPLKKDDHACQSTGYFARFMPDLKPSQHPVAASRRSLTKLEPANYPWRVDSRVTRQFQDEPELAFGEIL